MSYSMIIVPLCANIILAIVVNLQLKQGRELKEKIALLESTIQPIMQAQQVMMKADIDIERQIQDILKQIVSMDKQVQNLENMRHNDGGYQHALHILQMGGTKEEIIHSCHLTNAEAELLMNLHSYREAINA